jgi:hypothetical protein
MLRPDKPLKVRTVGAVPPQPQPQPSRAQSHPRQAESKRLVRGAIQITPTFNSRRRRQRHKVQTMFTLTLQVGKKFKFTIKVPASVILLIASMLA